MHVPVPSISHDVHGRVGETRSFDSHTLAKAVWAQHAMHRHTILVWKHPTHTALVRPSLRWGFILSVQPPAEL